MAKKKLMGKRKSDKHRLIYILLRKVIIIPSILVLTGFLFFVYHRNQMLMSIHSIFSKVNEWVVAHKNPSKSTIKKEAHLLAANHANDNPVHFEFYSVLPAAQISSTNITADSVDNALTANIKNQKQPQKKHLAKNLINHKET